MDLLLRWEPDSHILFVIFYCSLDKPNNKLIELFLAAAGARDMGARTVSLVAPYLCYMRQDKAFHCGEVVSQQVIGNLLAGYFDNVITVDAHLHRVHHLADAVPVSQAVNITATDYGSLYSAACSRALSAGTRQ